MTTAPTTNEAFYVPFGEMLHSIATGIAEGQFELDKSSMNVAELMSGQRVLRDAETGQPILDNDGKPQMIDARVYFGHDRNTEGKLTPAKLSMMELGFTPNFYQFVDTVIKMKLALKISRTGKGSYLTHATPVDAHYASTFNYNANLAVTVETKIVPIPPPLMLEERVRQLTDQQITDQQITDQQSPSQASTD